MNDERFRSQQKAIEACMAKLEPIFLEDGGELFLTSIGVLLQNISGNFTAPIVGRIIEELAELEW